MDQATTYLEILLCGIARWNLIWGDQLLSGSIFMISYGAVAVLCLWVAQQSDRKERWLWRLCGFLFLFQVLNTHLDLHAIPGAIGHCLAKTQGWYEQRGSFKLAALISLAVVVLIILLVMLIVFYRNIARNFLLISGVAIIVGFTVLKGVGYKEAEQLYGTTFGPFRLADFIEYSGIVIAMVAALKRAMHQHRAM